VNSTGGLQFKCLNLKSGQLQVHLSLELFTRYFESEFCDGIRYESTAICFGSTPLANIEYPLISLLSILYIRCLKVFIAFGA